MVIKLFYCVIFFKFIVDGKLFVELLLWNDCYIIINCVNEIEEIWYGFGFWYDDNVIFIGN